MEEDVKKKAPVEKKPEEPRVLNEDEKQIEMIPDIKKEQLP